MKTRILKTILSALLMSIICSFASFAGEWNQNETGWWYDNGDSTYAADGWHWIDGKCYYFTSDGYCLINTATPDGYTVGGDGAWTVDGIVQTQCLPDAQTHTLGELKLTTPDGFILLEMSNTEYKFFSYDYKTVIAVGLAEYNHPDFTETDYDNAAKSKYGEYTHKAMVQFGPTTWRRYYFETTEDPAISSMAIYYRSVVDNVYIAIIATSDESEPFQPNTLMAAMVNK